MNRKKEGVRYMMRSVEPNKQWKQLGVDRVVLLEIGDLPRPSLNRLEMLGYEIGAVINHDIGQIMVIQLPGDGRDKQVGVPVLELEDALREACRDKINVH